MAELLVEREVSPYGYFLSDGEQDVLLHYSEVTESVQTGERVRVFLFHDTEDRLSATMRQPLVQFGQMALLEVVDIHPRFGCFLEMGLGRNLLLPYKELPELQELRPRVGDRVFIVLSRDKQGRLLAKLAGEEELSAHVFHAPGSWHNQWLTARVYKSLQIGTFVICDGGVIGFGAFGFIHAGERTGPLRIGEELRVRVTHVREDGRVNLSLREPKERSRESDADRLLEFMQSRPGGAMPYSDETPADIISNRFGMSKAAFKRAVGKLMKEGRVYQKENWTYLRQEEQES